MSEKYSFDVTEDNFASTVIEASHQTPILVDFWATWCGPCQSLMPILMNLAESYQGQFLLAKVEIDQQQALATQFGVRSVPTVKLVKNGQVVDEFTGALPEQQIRQFLDQHVEKESDQLMQQAYAQYQNGDATALTRMGEIIEADQQNHQNIVIYAGVLMREGHITQAQQWLDALPKALQEEPEVATLRAQIKFSQIAQNAEGIEDLEKRIDKDPKDCEARYQLSAHYISLGKIEAAMDQLLEIVKRDRTFKDDIGRQTLIQVFELLGENKIVNQYRRKLAMALN